MAELALADVKKYLRVTGTDEDALITAQMTAAKDYIAGKTSKARRLSGNSGGEPVYTALASDSLYQQCVLLLVAHWYDTREIAHEGSLSPVEHTVDAIIAHIEGCSDYE